MEFHHHHEDSSSSLALPLFSSEPTSSSSTRSSKEMLQGVGSYFSMGQWHELEVQALIYKHMLSGSPIPPHLLHLLLNSNSTTNSSLYPLSNFPPLYQTGGGYWGRGGMDPEPGRCRRTDGKKWRCSRDVVAAHKYCERHIHRGRNRSRKPVEVPSPTTTATTAAGSRGASDYGGAHPYTTTAGGRLSGQSPFFDQRISENDNTKPSSDRTLCPFFNDWPQTVEEQEMLAMSLSINSTPGDQPSDNFSLKLSTGNTEPRGPRGEEEINGARERAPLNWGMLWGAGSTGGPLAEALRSASTSNSSSPTSVLHQLQLPSTTTSETSYVTT